MSAPYAAGAAERPIPSLHQGPKKRAAPVVKVCPPSVEQRAAWQAAADRAGLSLSAWLTKLADDVVRVTR